MRYPFLSPTERDLVGPLLRATWQSLVALLLLRGSDLDWQMRDENIKNISTTQASQVVGASTKGDERSLFQDRDSASYRGSVSCSATIRAGIQSKLLGFSRGLRLKVIDSPTTDDESHCLRLVLSLSSFGMCHRCCPVRLR